MEVHKALVVWQFVRSYDRKTATLIVHALCMYVLYVSTSYGHLQYSLGTTKTIHNTTQGIVHNTIPANYACVCGSARVYSSSLAFTDSR